MHKEVSKYGNKHSDAKNIILSSVYTGCRCSAQYTSDSDFVTIAIQTFVPSWQKDL